MQITSNETWIERYIQIVLKGVAYICMGRNGAFEMRETSVRAMEMLC